MYQIYFVIPKENKFDTLVRLVGFTIEIILMKSVCMVAVYIQSVR